MSPNQHDEGPNAPISAEEIFRELTRERGKDKRPEYSLHGPQVISGKLDLRNRTIEVALDIQNCEFTDEVDLRYCEFKQQVNFSRCIFRQAFNSGDSIEAHTLYQKDLICKARYLKVP